MEYEILEAIESYYGNDEDVYASCILWLKEHSKGMMFKFTCEEILEDMDRCPYCGEKLMKYEYDEYHDEVDAYEHRVESYCPNCGEY